MCQIQCETRGATRVGFEAERKLRGKILRQETCREKGHPDVKNSILNQVPRCQVSSALSAAETRTQDEISLVDASRVASLHSGRCVPCDATSATLDASSDAVPAQ